MKLTRPGVLEIKGPYPSSPLFYIRTETLQGFVVNHRASTIELLFITGFPSKIIDFTSGQLSNAVDLLTDFISQKATSTIINESRRHISPFDGKEFQDRLAYVESVLNKVPTIQEESSILSSSVQQIYELSMQLRSDLEAMKKADAEADAADAITEVECEDDGCECECYAQKPLPTQEPDEPDEPAKGCANSEATCIELFIASSLTAMVIIGVTLMSVPYMHTSLFS